MSDDLFNELAPWAVKAADFWCYRHGIDSRMRCDCVQEALIACWEATKRYNPEIGSEKTFCMCRMVGAIRDHLRREAPKGYRRGESLRVISMNGKESVIDPEDTRCAKEQRDAEIRDILDAIGSKLEGRNLLIWICLRNGMSNAEIAQRLNLSKARVWKLVSEIRERFGAK
jgi:RNA polymerase sigma factor (sigma-70 family)